MPTWLTTTPPKPSSSQSPAPNHQPGGADDTRRSGEGEIMSDNIDPSQVLSELEDAVSEAQALTQEVRAAATPLARARVEVMEQVSRRKSDDQLYGGGDNHNNGGGGSSSSGHADNTSSQSPDEKQLEELQARVARALHTRQVLERDVTALEKRWNEKIRQINQQLDEASVAAQKHRRSTTDDATTPERQRRTSSSEGDDEPKRSAVDYVIGGLVAIISAQAIGYLVTAPFQHRGGRKRTKSQRDEDDTSGVAPEKERRKKRKDKVTTTTGEENDHINNSSTSDNNVDLDEIARSAASRAKEFAKSAASRATNIAKSAVDHTMDAVDRTKDFTKSTVDRTKDVAKSAVDRTKDVTKSAVDRTKKSSSSSTTPWWLNTIRGLGKVTNIAAGWIISPFQA
mmetsp:Transcript_16775/g.42961  ORF Transcript_16775/g.42961 Transcript_16775/m.42961 type:complete len:398 (-) Transcript_16775:145-1338(-)